MKLDAKIINFGTLVLYPASLAVCLTGKTLEVPERFTEKRPLRVTAAGR